MRTASASRPTHILSKEQAIERLESIAVESAGDSVTLDLVVKGYMGTVPGSLDESAAVEGASLWRVFARVILPLSRPVLAVIFIITFIGIYSEYILARTLLRSADNLTLALGLQLFVSSDYSARWGNLSAAALIGAAPIVLTFLIAQRQIIGGLTRGAVKG